MIIQFGPLQYNRCEVDLVIHSRESQHPNRCEFDVERAEGDLTQSEDQGRKKIGSDGMPEPGMKQSPILRIIFDTCKDFPKGKCIDIKPD